MIIKYCTCTILIALGLIVLVVGFANLHSPQNLVSSGYSLYSWLVSGVAEILMGCTLLLNGARWSTVALGLIAILNLITYNFTMQADFDIWVSGFIILTILGIVNKFLVGGRNM